MVLSRGCTDAFADLPIVGIRATLKEDLSCTSAEMVYGTTLRLYAKTVVFNAAPPVCSYYTRWHGRRAVYFPPDLHTATHMYVRRDSHKPPLTRPYHGPFRVLRRFDKHFTLDDQFKTIEITVDRLKPAKLIGDPGTVELPAAVSAPHSPTLPAPRENTSTSTQVPSHLPTTTREGPPLYL